MQSFYGGRQGLSCVIKKQFPSISEMNEFFIKGSETASEVGYGEYVVIHTPHDKDAENGDVYRRGFDGAEGPLFNILGPAGPAPATELRSREEVAKYIEENKLNNAQFDDTWVYGEGAWGPGRGTNYTIYQLISDPSVTITEEAWNALSAIGQQSYKETNTISYIRYNRYYIHTNGVNIITRAEYKELTEDEKRKYSVCYISKKNPDIRINKATYDGLSAEGKKDYTPYAVSDDSDIITQADYNKLPSVQQAEYEECYVDKVYGTEYIALPEYLNLSAEEQDKYNPYVSIFYLASDPSKKISIYVYDGLTKLGKNDYRPVTYVKSKGMYTPNHDGNSFIYYAYANVLDEHGNVESNLLGFEFPYFEENFFLQPISPYKKDGSRYSEKDELPIKIHNGKDFNYYKEWTLSIPQGVQGDSITNVFVAAGFAPAGTPVRNIEGTVLADDMEFESFILNSKGVALVGEGHVDGLLYQVELSNLPGGLVSYYWAEVTDYSVTEKGSRDYHRMGEYQSIAKICIAEDNGEGYNLHDLLILYNDAAHLGNITYDGIDGWYNIGNTRGKIQGLRVFTIFNSISAFEIAIADNPTPEELAAIRGVDDPDNCMGWGVLVLDGEDGWIYFFDYGQKVWKKCSSHIGGGLAEPTAVLYIGSAQSGTAALNSLAEEGYWLKTEGIRRAY